MEEATLLFRHLPLELTTDERKDLLHHLGATRVQVMGRAGLMKNTAFAVFPSKEEATKLIKQLHQVEFLGSKLRVEFAHKESSRVGSVVDNEGVESKADGEVDAKKETMADLTPEARELKFDETFNAWGVKHPRRPDLYYVYPPPTPSILTNIMHALAAVPKFYVQVLHLMNKMDLPAPFGAVTCAPPVHPDVRGYAVTTDDIDQREMDISSETESELESDEEERRKRPKDGEVPVRQPRPPKISSQRQRKRPRLSDLQDMIPSLLSNTTSSNSLEVQQEGVREKSSLIASDVREVFDYQPQTVHTSSASTSTQPAVSAGTPVQYGGRKIELKIPSTIIQSKQDKRKNPQILPPPPSHPQSVPQPPPLPPLPPPPLSPLASVTSIPNPNTGEIYSIDRQPQYATQQEYKDAPSHGRKNLDQRQSEKTNESFDDVGQHMDYLPGSRSRSSAVRDSVQGVHEQQASSDSALSVPHLHQHSNITSSSSYSVRSQDRHGNFQDIPRAPSEAGVTSLRAEGAQQAGSFLYDVPLPPGYVPAVEQIARETESQQQLSLPRDQNLRVNTVEEDESSASVGFGRLQPSSRALEGTGEEDEEGSGEKEWTKSRFISSSELRKKRLSHSEMKDYSVFRKYNEGEPSCRLYIKNLAKQVTEEDIHWIYGRYVDWDDETEKIIFDIRLMKEGRMKGQAFVTLPSEKVATAAVKDTNGFLLKEKPMVVQFARSAKAAEDEASKP